MPPEELKSNLAQFVAFAQSLKGDEKSEAQSFVDQFFRAPGRRLRNTADDADPLAFLLELNLACAAKENAGERITPPGLPLQEKDRVAFTNEDCIQQLGT